MIFDGYCGRKDTKLPDTVICHIDFDKFNLFCVLEIIEKNILKDTSTFFEDEEIGKICLTSTKIVKID